MGSPSEIPPDTLLGGRIRLMKRIGRGGMGDVWIARNEATQAEVAVKTLVKAERNETHDERFRREARLAATISHRNVVRIFDLVDDSDGTLALVMELLRGGTLEACMRERGALSSMQAVAVAVPILSALHHVHQKGIIHRDVKPANIFFAVEPDGHVIPKILDFGIAKLPSASSSLTVDGSVLGTPHYMSPEQIRGQEDLDGRSDMFSLAVVLFEMLTGTRVFQRDSAAASLAAVLEHEVDPDPKIEPKIWVALSRALSKRPYERQANCAELAETLRAAVDATDEELAQSLQELRPRSDTIPETAVVGASGASSSRQRKKSKERPLGLTIGAAAAAAALAALVTFAATRSDSTARADDAKAATSSSVATTGAAATGAASAAAPSSTSAEAPTSAPTAAPAPTMIELVETQPTGPIQTPVVKHGGGGATGGAGTGASRPPPPPPSKPTGQGKPAGTKPLATTPGF